MVFKTTKVTVQLLDSKDDPLAGGIAEYHASGWKQFGEKGEANSEMELLPVQYSFRVTYDGATQQKSNVQIAEAATDVVTFQTGAIILHYAGGTLSYHSSGWKDYTGAREMLPVRTQFRLQRSGWPNVQFYITPEAGQVYEKTIAVIRLVDSNGNGLAGGTASYYDSGWKTLGNTGDNGIYLAMLDGNKAKSMTFKMELGGGSNQLSQNLATDSYILFQTKSVTFRLLDSNNNALKGGASYYAGGWKTFGSGATETSMELLTGSYTFKVNYNGASIQKSHNIGEDPVVEFRTVPVTVVLKSSDDKPLEGTASFYAGGWQEIGPTGTLIELLPTSYTFKVTYLGASNQRAETITGPG